MSWSQTKASQYCATCANWGGVRTEHLKRVEVEHPDTRGKCYAGVFCGVTQGPRACDGHSCSKYQLWPALK